MTKTKELSIKVVEKELNPIVAKAKSLKITSSEEMETASEYLSQLKIQRDRVVEVLDSIIAPAKTGIKAAEAIWKPAINIAKEAIELIREKQSNYQTEQTRIAEEKEAKIAARTGEGKGKIGFDTAVRKMEEIDRPDTRIHTTSGSVAFRTDQVFEVIDISKLPTEYLLPNEVKIRQAMKAGIKVEGVRYSTKQVPINRT